jgi:hypothetical protein
MQLHSIQTYNQSVLPIAHLVARIGTLFFSPIMVGWQATLVKSVSLFLHFHNSPKEVRAYNIQSTLLNFVGQFEIGYDLVVDEPQLS